MTNDEAIKWLANLKTDIGNPHYECLWPYAQAIDEIAELLEEQETGFSPKEIKMYPGNVWACGNCGHVAVGSADYKAKHCPECGKAVKWDDRV